PGMGASRPDGAEMCLARASRPDEKKRFAGAARPGLDHRIGALIRRPDDEILRQEASLSREIEQELARLSGVALVFRRSCVRLHAVPLYPRCGERCQQNARAA